MKHCYRALRLLLGALWLAAASPAFASTSHTSSLAQIVLQSRDLPAGFQTVHSGYLSSSTIAHVSHLPVGNLKRQGWVNGYEAVFKQPGAGLSIQNVINHYASANLAHLLYRQLASGYAMMFHAYHPRRIAATSLAQNATEITFDQRINGLKVSVVSIAFAQGSYVALINVAGPSSALKQISAVHVAQRVQSRMRQGG